jgi:hypothetical protein
MHIFVHTENITKYYRWLIKKVVEVCDKIKVFLESPKPRSITNFKQQNEKLFPLFPFCSLKVVVRFQNDIHGKAKNQIGELSIPKAPQSTRLNIAFIVV